MRINSRTEPRQGAAAVMCPSVINSKQARKLPSPRRGAEGHVAERADLAAGSHWASGKVALAVPRHGAGCVTRRASGSLVPCRADGETSGLPAAVEQHCFL